ncbi:MAG: hypothetical protein WC876_03545 [Candidatus Thermoplasmatota archaeon]|jgi:hypothetical protein
MTSSDSSADLPSRKRLVVATAIALAVALLVVVPFVMPAEYGVDPTGFGKLSGIDQLYSAEPSVADPDAPALNSTGRVLAAFNISWAPREAAAGEHEGELAPGESKQVPFTVSSTNVTRVTAILSWSDEPVAGQQSDPDLFQVNLTSPAGETRSFLGRNEGPSGSLTASFIVNGFPAPTTVLAEGHDEALDLAHAASPARLEGTGDWLAEVTLVEAGGVAVVPDPGNAWTLRLFVQTFIPAVGDPVLTPIREDVVKMTVPARGQLEFKARMSEGADLTYKWTAPAELNYEFHGDAQGAQGDRFESYEKGTAASQEGTFKAPFTGRHGWYWQNSGVADVEVTLNLRGDYVIVGIV